MSGLLERLAARATGATAAIRPIDVWNMSVLRPDPAPPVPEAQRIDALREAAPRRAPHSSDARLSEPPLAAEEVPSRLPEHAPRPASMAVNATAPVAGPLASTVPDEAVAGETPATRSGRVERPAGAAHDTRSSDDPAPFEPLLPTGTAPPSPRALSRPIVPPPQRAPASVRSDPSSYAADEATEVHVTIGRIELTAVQEAPRMRREPVGTRKPQSLEDYLARRATERR